MEMILSIVYKKFHLIRTQSWQHSWVSDYLFNNSVSPKSVGVLSAEIFNDIIQDKHYEDKNAQNYRGCLSLI